MSNSYTPAHVVLWSVPMRLFVLLALLAGCPAQLADKEGLPGNGSGGLGSPAECAIDSDCALAGAKCCDCPTFAVPTTDPAYNACKGVACPTPATCPTNIRAACNAGHCDLACVASTCTTSCADGYATDASGCLTCECAKVDQRACLVASDCARVRADCCGCTLGGEDTAVPTSQVAAHDASLQCPPSPSCPQVDTCAPDLVPQCVQGTCELISGGVPVNACGRPDLADCPAGAACTINSDPSATQQGVGVCVPAT